MNNTAIEIPVLEQTDRDGDPQLDGLGYSRYLHELIDRLVARQKARQVVQPVPRTERAREAFGYD